MSMAVQPYIGMDQQFDASLMEQFILKLGDIFDIQISWGRNTVLVTSVCAVAGGLVGSYSGGRLGAALGAGIASATGFGVATLVSLRDLWDTVKVKLQELLYVVFNYLRRLDPIDYLTAIELVMASRSSRRDLVIVILDFIATKLGRDVISSIGAVWMDTLPALA